MVRQENSAGAPDGNFTPLTYYPMNCTHYPTNCTYYPTLRKSRSVIPSGIVGTVFGTLWYVNWEDKTSIRLVGGHPDTVNDIAVGSGDTFAVAIEDGSLRLWNYGIFLTFTITLRGNYIITLLVWNRFKRKEV